MLAESTRYVVSAISLLQCSSHLQVLNDCSWTMLFKKDSYRPCMSQVCSTVKGSSLQEAKDAGEGGV